MVFNRSEKMKELWKNKEYKKMQQNSHLGYKHTQEAKQKISEALKGRKVWNKGKKGIFSEEVKIKLTKQKKGI